MKSQHIIARFVPQAWVNDQAIDVDPEGETEWDATRAFATMPASYRESLTREMSEDTWSGEALDRHDFLRDDPDAPQWVRDWRGPFDIYVRLKEEQ